MADTTTVVEGKIKFRDGKKWKPRWCVLKKPSPVADRLQVILYKDLTEYTKNEIKPKSVFALDAFFGLDAGFTYDRELHVLAIICYKNTSLMAFELRENMIQFEIKIRQSMGEEHQFPVKVVKAPSSSKIPKDPVRMIIHDMRFCLIAQTPPKIILSWNVEDLRRFGATEGKFCFEGGTRCGKGSGIFAFQSEQAEDIAHIVNLASTGKMANCHRKFKNRRRHSRPDSQEMVNEINYITLVVPIDKTQGEESGGTTSSNIASLSYSLSEPATYFSNIYECTNPAKTILRPRSGSEYVLVRRKSVPSPVSFSGSSSHSPFFNNVFNFEVLKPNEAIRRSHNRHSLQSSVLPLLGHIFLSEHSCLPNNPQGSPSVSSTSGTIRSASSIHFHPWENEPAQSHHGKSHTRIAPATSSPASSPRTILSHHSKYSTQLKSAPIIQNEGTVFFPMDTSFSTSPPPSPFVPHSAGIPVHHPPIYVNQEFVDKYHIASSSSQTVNASSGHSSTSPIRAGVQSLMSLIFKDSSKQNLNESNAKGSTFRIGRTRSRRSESDTNKDDTHSLSLPSNKQQQHVVVPTVPRRCHSDSRKHETESNQQFTLAAEIHLSDQSKVHKKEYDKFAHSSIISRRRQKCLENMHNESTEKTDINISAECFRQDPSPQYLSLPKSSGYKNIDCINAAAASTPSPRSLSSGPDASHVGQTSQLENIMESHINPDDLPSSNRSSVFSETNRLSNAFVFIASEPISQEGSMPMPHPDSTPPLLPPRRHCLSSSPLSSCSLTSVLTSSDSSDSPPSYFAPSPPSTPPLPVLPPRIPLLSPKPFIPVSTPLEPETTSDFSEEEQEQELNYIEVDMSRCKTEVVRPPPPHAYSRRSKRARQQKEKDYAKLRYAVIDHRATKALQEARQEHEQCRDGSQRHIQQKDINLGRLGTQLSRINSAPASSKRKQISLMQRERKLSSGSTESC